MKPGEYPRPQPAPALDYPNDKTWGAIIVAFSALRLLTSGASLSRLTPGSTAQTLTMVLLALLAIRLVGGVGVFLGRRWGLILVAFVSSAYVLISLFNLSTGNSLALLLLAISAYMVFYCVRRLTGQEGPRPV